MDFKLLIHLGNILYLASYLVKDIFLLRFILLIAMFVFLPYYIFNFDEPAWEPLIWSFVFIGVNVYQLIKLFQERRPVVLSAEDAAIHEQSFSMFTLKQFEKLLRFAKKEEYNPKQNILSAGQSADRVIFLIKGDVTERDEEKVMGKLGTGDFLASMNYLTDSPVVASYLSESDSQIISWDRSEFDRLINSDPEFKANWQTLISKKLVERLNDLEK